MSIISVAVLPEGIDISNFSKVSFLGPILEETIFDMMLKNEGTRTEAIYSTTPAASRFIDLDVKPEMPKYEFSKQTTATGQRADTFRGSLRNILSGQKKIPRYSLREVVPVRHQKESFALEGSVHDRGIFYKPGFPSIKRRIDIQDASFNMELKFVVSPKGRVERVEPVVSSGYTDVDLVGMRYMRRWLFVSLRKDQDQAYQWGKIRLNFKMEK
ncbi:MAG: energy transducer TonB [Candidatus Omnitrophica bacterium]|nr:energy transducer TonB [Candidatus Omnitrophota bacterium]